MNNKEHKKNSSNNKFLGSKEDAKTYRNPIANGADPFILPWDGKYYVNT